MAATASLPDDVRLVRDGHLLRWTKQMALRGRSREFDENGMCGKQKLVVTGDLTLLLGNLQRVFPGAKVRGEQGDVAFERHKKLTNLERLLRYLGTAGLPIRVDTKQIGDHFERPWREISGDLTRRKDFDRLLANAGWRYVRKLVGGGGGGGGSGGRGGGQRGGGPHQWRSTRTLLTLIERQSDLTWRGGLCVRKEGIRSSRTWCGVLQGKT